MTVPLRVVVVVDDHVVPAAVARTIERVAEAPVELLGVRVLSRGTRTPGADGLSLVDRAERALFRPAPDATAPVDLRRGGRGLVASQLMSAREDLDEVDVLLDLTTEGTGAREAQAARLGVWSLRYGHDRRRLGPDAFVPEYLLGSDAAVCELVVEAGSDAPATPCPRVGYRSVSAVDRLSSARTRNEAAWKSAEFPARLLTAITARGPAALEAPGSTTPAPSLAPQLHPTGVLAGTVLRRGVREAARRAVSRPTWCVAVRTGGTRRPGDPDFDTRGFHILTAPRDRFYADPFVVQAPDGGAHVFVEDGPRAGGPARISVVTLGDDGEQRQPSRAVLERPTHLSYPFVFRDGGEWYLLPETAGTGTVELFRARDFPWRWEPCHVVLRGVRAWDPTLLRHDGRYWLFVTMAAPGARPSDELCLYSAPALTGPWEPHPRNPVVSDARRARPAGRILETDAGLLRPAQDGSGDYGRRIVLNRIEVLDTERYRESPVGSIEPGWLPGVVRTHTYTADGTFEVLDGVRHERRYGRPRPR